MKNFFLAVVILFLFLVIASFFLPSVIHIKKSIFINADIKPVFEQVNNLRNWNNWWHWIKLDTSWKQAFTDTESGAGASYTWESNMREVGNGKMTIITSVPDDSIVVMIEWMDRGIANLTFHFSETINGTQVMWIFYSDLGKNPIRKYMGLFMKKEFEKNFEICLTNIKTFAEASHTRGKTFRGYEIVEKNGTEMIYIGKKDSLTWDKINEFCEKNILNILKAIGKHKLEPITPPSRIFFSRDTVNKFVVMAIAIGVTGGNASTIVKGYETFVMPAGKILHIEHFGAHEKMVNAHYGMDDYMREKGYILNGAVIEEYVTDILKEPDTTKWLSNIYYRVK